MKDLIGEDILLREFRQEDISGLRSWVNDDSARFLGAAYIKPQTWEQTEAYLASLLRGDAGGLNLVIADKTTRRYLGQISLMMIDQSARRAELAIVMAPDSAGKGYATQAIRVITRYAFEQLNLRRLYLQVHADNNRARHVYDKCGFAEEGRLREHIYRDGQYIDLIQMGLLRRDPEHLEFQTLDD